MEHKCINEIRIRTLEIHEASTGTEIKNLIKKMDSLANWIKALMIMFGTAGLTAFGYLVVEWVKK